MKNIWYYSLSLAIIGIFASNPSSTNYTLKTYDFGSGGGKTNSSNYSLRGIVNGQAGNSTTSTNYQSSPGPVSAEIIAAAPTAPSISNPSNFYNKLKIVINLGTKAKTTKFAIAISNDNFSTTKYVKADHSIGNTLDSNDYQTQANWGGSSGFNILGLTPNTSYKAKVKVSGSSTYSNSTSAVATINPEISFAATSPTGAYFTNLIPGQITSVFDSPDFSLSTNADNGGGIYAYDSNGGLHSNNYNYTLSSATADLSNVSEGYGGQIVNISQSSGGPFTAVAPYNLTGNNVGAVSTSMQKILNSAGPITGGAASLDIKAKVSINTPISNDYTDTMTFISAMMF